MKTLAGIFLFFIILFGSCQKKSGISYRDDLFTPMDPVVTEFSPNPVIPGAVLAIKGEHLDDVLFTFNGEKLAIDSGSAAVKYVKLPPNVFTGNIVLYTATDSIIGPTLYVFHPCVGPVCLSSYSGPVITDSIGFSSRSGVVLKDDTITVTQTIPAGDDNVVTRTLRFSGGDSIALPRWIGGTVQAFTYGSVLLFTDSLQGYIEIERWNDSGVFSGRVYGYSSAGSSWYEFYFLARKGS